MKLEVKTGSTNVSILVFIQDSSSTVGAGLTGLAYDTSNLVCYYAKGANTAPVQVTLATQTSTGAHADGGFVEKDSTNMPGVYRLDLPDACFTGSHNTCIVMLKGAANMAPVALEIQNTSFSPATAGVDMADALLDRNMSSGTDSGSTTVRTPRQALRFLRNKWAVATGTLTVYKEDDSTSSWTSTLSTTGSADAIIGSDPAGP